MREPLVSEPLAKGLCLLLIAGALAALIVGHPLAAPIPTMAILAMLVARRADIKGGLLYLGLLSVLALGVYGICLGCSFLFPFLGGKVPLLVATLVIIKELQRFLDNEYGDGRLGRRLGIALLAVLAAAAQVFLVVVS